MTGESRGFAFVDFESIDDATAVLQAFDASPLVIDHRAVNLAYADSNRPRRYPVNGDTARDALPDWLCDQCQSSNFARRSSCLKCQAPKSPFAMEMPHGSASGGPSAGGYHRGDYYHPTASSYPPANHDNQDPSNVLIVRMIPLHAEEGELQVAFAPFEGVRAIRLIRDRVTNQSRGFAFVEFADLETAANVINWSASTPLEIDGAPLRLNFARDSLHTRSTSRHAFNPGPAVPLNPIAAAAMEQAQWSFTTRMDESHTASDDGSAQTTALGIDDVNELLESAAAAARPRIEEPKKPWPLPFETGGGMYTYVNDVGLYYDTDSMFYYDPHAKLYYNQFLGKYFRCADGHLGANATFTSFTPPVPCDDAQVGANPSALRHNAASSHAEAGIKLALPKKKQMKPISFGLKPATALATRVPGVFAAASAASSSDPAAIAAPAAPVVRGASGVSAGMKKKSALDIAKWSQRQRESKLAAVQQPEDSRTPSLSAFTPPAIATAAAASREDADVNADALSVPLEVPICLLCRRKFASMDQLRKHESKSKLHAENLAKAKQDKAVVAAQIREQDEKDKDKQQPRGAKRQRAVPPTSLPSASPPVAADKPSQSLAEGFGGKMMKMMGWTHGALGKHGTGITEPIAAVGNLSHDTTGLGARTLPAVDLSSATTTRERLQKIARARYDATTTDHV